MNYHQLFQDYINKLKGESLYRQFRTIQRTCGEFPKAQLFESGVSREIIVWCSNDILCMGEHLSLLNAAKKAIDQEGVGSGGSRNLSGNTYNHELLEQTIAQLHKKEAGLIFTSGYVANTASLLALSRIIPDLIFFSDKNNHASIIDALRGSKDKTIVFAHNNTNDLESKLKLYHIDQPKMIVFESVYSMDGDISPIEEICRVAKKYGAMTYIDEVHSVGLFGNKGEGLAVSTGCADQIDIIQGCFAKSYGLMGGYITGSAHLIDAIRCAAAPFIFTTSLTPSIVAPAVESIKYLSEHNEKRINLFRNVASLRSSLIEKGIPFLQNQTHITPVMIGDSEVATLMSDHLLNAYNIYVQVVNFPSVAKGTERFRVTITPQHTQHDIIYFTDALRETFLKFCCDKIISSDAISRGHKDLCDPESMK